MLEKKQEKNEEENGSKNQKYVNNALKQLIIDQKQSNSNSFKSSMSSFLQGKGFKYLAGYTQSQSQIVKPQFARKTFQRLLQNCAECMIEKSKEILNCIYDFGQKYTYDFQRKVIPHVTIPNREIKILCIEFIKKKKACFMSYIVMHYNFELAPNIIKQTIQSSSQISHSLSAKFGDYGIGFSFQLSHSSSQENILEKERGVTPQDLGMLVQLANVDNSRRSTVLKMFYQGQFEDIHY